jgi:crotonobetainyl-CoA:carnitine CoA-transferase CaiB-like acyl-CoA transferase
MAGALDGIRILDLTSVIAGPYATQIMGDMGADIIKIEGPDGDTTRTTGPSRNDGMAAMYLGVNRGKRSVQLDLKQASGSAALWKLIETADVLVHSIRPQKLAKLGFSDSAVRERNPRLIYVGLHGFGSGGPYAGRPAYDDVIQGQSGAADLMQRVTGEPRYMPMIMADKTVGTVLTYSVCAALFARERTGQGQFIEVPMFESMVAYNLLEHQYGSLFEPPVNEPGYPRVLAPWRRPYKTQDGYCCMLAYTDAQWSRFWQEVGATDSAADPRFSDLQHRTEHIGLLYETAGKYMATRSTAQWLEVLERLEIPHGPVNTLADLYQDPHLKAQGFFRTEQHPTEGTLTMPGFPVRFSGTPAGSDRLPPRQGEHTEEVLRDAGLPDELLQQVVEAMRPPQSNDNKH